MDVPVLPNKGLHQLCVDTRSTLEDLPGAMNDRDWWQKSVKEFYFVNTTWWYVCVCVCIYIYDHVCVGLNNKDKFCLYNLRSFQVFW